MITSEIAPYAKVGGLGDVVSALSRELSNIGHDVRVVCPFYGLIKPGNDWFMHEQPLLVPLGARQQEICEVWEARFPRNQVHLYFLKNANYFGGNTIYNGESNHGHQKNGERFVLLSRGGIELCPYLDWIPDVVHCHDWITGLVPVYLKTVDSGTPMGSVPTVLTIHNMQHQGVFGPQILDFAGLPQTLFTPEALEFMDHVNMLKGGIIYATKLTTVSERYAWEIVNSEMGCGLNSTCEARKDDLTGILNGIDVVEWNPQNDPFLPKNFNLTQMDGKKDCKLYLQKYFNLKQDPKVALFGAVARLYSQKGLDLLAEIVPRLMETELLQIVLLGVGDSNLEAAFKSLSLTYKHHIGVNIGYNLELAHLIEAGLDFFVMPSRFEPCGLNQMYSLTYGAVPIVRRTGGLADTVVPYSPGTENSTGFVFDEMTGNALYDSIRRACSIFYHKPDDYRLMQVNGMKTDFSWVKSVKKYENVYADAIYQNSQSEKDDYTNL